MDICPKCGLPLAACVCGEIAKTQQQIAVTTEKRRFGKVNTMISGFDDGVDKKIKRRKHYMFEGKTVDIPTAIRIWDEVKEKEKKGEYDE